MAAEDEIRIELLGGPLCGTRLGIEAGTPVLKIADALAGVVHWYMPAGTATGKGLPIWHRARQEVAVSSSLPL